MATAPFGGFSGRAVNDPRRCVQCGGEFLGGEPMHEMRVSWNNEPEHIELYCIDCIDWYSECCWNDEEWGPYPSRLQHRRPIVGHA